VAGKTQQVGCNHVGINLSAWKDYQQLAAAFFRKLGLEATVEKELHGARGVHKVDVYVTGDYMGIVFTWIVECKHWRSNIPKEKVAALAGVLQDIGSDRGFLLSEKGFQSGALRMAEKSNITLRVWPIWRQPSLTGMLSAALRACICAYIWFRTSFGN
jgi:predicted Mrr-cat superfamily restriction endonuclease